MTSNNRRLLAGINAMALIAALVVVPFGSIWFRLAAALLFLGQFLFRAVVIGPEEAEQAEKQAAEIRRLREEQARLSEFLDGLLRTIGRCRVLQTRVDEFMQPICEAIGRLAELPAEAGRSNRLIEVADGLAAALRKEIPSVRQKAAEMTALAEACAASIDEFTRNGLAWQKELEHQRQYTAAHRACLLEIAEQYQVELDGACQALASCDTFLSAWKRPADEISRAVQTATDLAEQARILGVNASIEALRSGPAGSGFSLIANEAEHLSDRMLRVAHQIAAQVAEGEHAMAKAGEGLAKIRSALARAQEIGRWLASREEAAAGAEWGTAQPPLASVPECLDRWKEAFKEVDARIGELGGPLVPPDIEQARMDAVEFLAEVNSLGAEAKSLLARLADFLGAVHMLAAELAASEASCRESLSALSICS